MLLVALAEEQPVKATDLWEWNGGNAELLAVAREHHAWLAALPLTTIRGPYLFVHAGVRPGVPLEGRTRTTCCGSVIPFGAARMGCATPWCMGTRSQGITRLTTGRIASISTPGRSEPACSQAAHCDVAHDAAPSH